MKLPNAINRWPCSLLPLILITSSTYAAVLGDENVVNVNDADGDRIVDTIDVDDDNDGIPDVEEISGNGLDVDSDFDGIPNRLDLDSDNDGILDWQESGAVISVDFSAMRVVSGRILGKVGLNGFIDALETSIDNGQMRYSLVNSDSQEDNLPDVLDLDSDNDGLTDLREAGVDASYDADNDARIDIDNVNSSVGNDGIPDRLQKINDGTCCDVNGDGVEDIIPRNTDGSDLPDFQDLDSDNDGVSDLIESGGGDFDRDGRVDNFFDSPVLDGMDDTFLLIPFEAPDNNGNAVPDFIDEFAQSGTPSTPEQPTNTPTPPVSDSVPPADDDPTPATPEVDPTPVVTEDDTAPESPASTDEGSTPESPTTAEDAPPTTEDGQNETVVRDPVERPGSDILTGTSSQPLEDDPSTGVINTGLNASGCSIQSTGIDLIVLLLSVFSIATLGWRYTLRRVRR